MIKKGFTLVLIASFFLTFTSCGLDYRYSLDENLRNQIECVWEDDEPSYIVYNGDKYKYAGTTNFFDVCTYKDDDNYYKSYEDDVLLSWNGHRYVGYIDEYYSYTTDSPVFIYNERLHLVYFGEDYNYLTDLFVIDNTNAEIAWKDIYYSEQSDFEFVDPIEVVLYSKQYPRIKTYLKLASVENRWYLSFHDSKNIYVPSDKFLQILSENKII